MQYHFLDLRIMKSLKIDAYYLKIRYISLGEYGFLNFVYFLNPTIAVEVQLDESFRLVASTVQASVIIQSQKSMWGSTKDPLYPICQMHLVAL